jgi:hypothetical protein
MAVFVLVPGAWLGGWCWRDLAAWWERGQELELGPTPASPEDIAGWLAAGQPKR